MGSLVFTWNTAIPVAGAGWGPGETVSVALRGPLDSPGVSPSSVALGTVSADSQGAFSTSLTIPYDQGVVGAQANIPRPGVYTVTAAGPASGAVSSAYPVNLAPATYLGAGNTIDWSHERGTRVGVLPGPLAAYAPERSDPNWISVWDNRPVEVYGTAAGPGGGGDNQASRISYEDDPITHYAHDTNLFLVPDPRYRWVVGTANYYANGETEGNLALGRIEVEWETLNNGNTTSYGTGSIGMPVWAMPTVGDRVYVVGRWVLDAGHPEVGDRTEIHPPRLVAAMRQRPAVSSGGAASTQVDIYVSGHGGAANRYPSGMDALLDLGGHGGGRLRDVLSASDQQTYYQPGPLPVLQLPLVELLVASLTGSSISGPIYPVAGPSAFSWGTPAPEQQPVNDMDYDFDVPLPPPPPGAVSVNVEVTTHPQHSTAVTEAVTFPASGNIAHIHLPYHGADNGIYARTLKFTWNTAAAPPHHFRISVDNLTVKALPGAWQMWSDVSGQWSYLSGLAPALLQTASNQVVAIPGAQYEVYLRPTDTLRVFVQGYRPQCVDRLFGTLFGVSSYSAGIQLLQTCGPVNNDDLGGAVLELAALPSSQGTYTISADTGSFQAGVTVEYVNPVTVPSECQGRGSLTPSISGGGIVGAGLSVPAVTQMAPEGLVSIFGQNFAPAGTARGLTAADVAGGQLPANLACTCVMVNQQLAPVLFVSPTQINIQSPAPSTGSDAVQVIANCGASTQSASAAQTISAKTAAAGFFFFQQNANGADPVAAVNALTGALVGTSGLLPGLTFAPAKPGDLISLYLTGLGQTDPALAAGVLANGAAASADPVSVSLNGTPLPANDILYAGAAPGYAGLYQVNIRIPAGTPAGNLPLSLTIDGVTTPAGAYLAVKP